METLTPVKFPKAKQNDFNRKVRARVRDYFAENNISQYANWNMYLKTIFMVSAYFTPYILMVLGVITHPLLIAASYVMMGFSVAGIGLCIMHDANHGSYSKNGKVNKILGHILNVIGGNALNWKIQHNVLHHTYTNIDGWDEDISRAKIVRCSPEQKLRKFHRFQHIYAWMVYGLLTLAWVFGKEIPQLIRYNQRGLIKKSEGSMFYLISKLVISKLTYIGYMIILPILVTDIPWWGVILGFLGMHFLAGFLLGCIFQPAHVTTDVKFPEQNPEDGSVEDSWAVHQMYTTANFAQDNRLFTWLVGGLNHQVEHHLFPNICHVHYPEISKIVKQTAEECGVPYYSRPSFTKAVWEHGVMLKHLGNTPPESPDKNNPDKDKVKAAA